MTDTELVRELVAVGLDCGVRDGAIVTWHSPLSPTPFDDELAALVVEAHEQAADSAPVLALKALLGAASEEWAAYVAVRNRAARNARRDRYAVEADPLALKALESATIPLNGSNYELQVPTADWDAWRAAKAQIREDLPYPIEE